MELYWPRSRVWQESLLPRREDLFSVSLRCSLLSRRRKEYQGKKTRLSVPVRKPATTLSVILAEPPCFLRQVAHLVHADADGANAATLAVSTHAAGQQQDQQEIIVVVLNKLGAIVGHVVVVQQQQQQQDAVVAAHYAALAAVGAAEEAAAGSAVGGQQQDGEEVVVVVIEAAEG